MTDETKTNLQTAHQQIRKAYNARKSTITIDGIVLALSLQTRNPTSVIDGVLTRRREQWIIAKPADGTMLPRYSVERKDAGNLRSKNVGAV